MYAWPRGQAKGGQITDPSLYTSPLLPPATPSPQEATHNPNQTKVAAATSRQINREGGGEEITARKQTKPKTARMHIPWFIYNFIHFGG